MSSCETAKSSVIAGPSTATNRPVDRSSSSRARSSARFSGATSSSMGPV